MATYTQNGIASYKSFNVKRWGGWAYPILLLFCSWDRILERPTGIYFHLWHCSFNQKFTNRRPWLCTYENLKRIIMIWIFFSFFHLSTNTVVWLVGISGWLFQTTDSMESHYGVSYLLERNSLFQLLLNHGKDSYWWRTDFAKNEPFHLRHFVLL